MYLHRALILICSLQINGGKVDEKASEKPVNVVERIKEKCAFPFEVLVPRAPRSLKRVFPFEVSVPRAPRSVRKRKESKTRKNSVSCGRRIRNCSECGLTFRGNKAFEEHAFSRHKGMKLVSCEKCDKKFFKFDRLYDHTRVRHKRRNNCKFCGKKCSLEAMEEHEETCMKIGNKIEIKEIEREWMSPTYCGLCDSNFPSYTSYREHCRKSHRGEKVYPCRFCSKRFAAGNYLSVHLETHHAAEMAKAGEKSRRCRRGLAYSCPHCEVVVKGVWNYEQHGKNDHPELAMFECATCGEGFRWKNAADRHAKEKHGEDKKCCRYCSKCYSRLDRMKQHEEACGRKLAVAEERKVRVLNKDANLKKDRMGGHYCDICDKTMYVLDITFKRHVSTHENFDYCDKCGDRFHRKRYPDGLENHMKLRHPLRDNVDALLETARSSGVKFESEEVFGKPKVLTGWHLIGCSTYTSNVVGKNDGDGNDDWKL